MITIENLQLNLDSDAQDAFAKHLAAGVLEHLGNPLAYRPGGMRYVTPAPGVTPPLGELWPGQGGHYVGILPAIGDRPAMYMIAGPETDSLKWGPYEEETGATSRHDGRANTKALLAGGKGSKYPAAAWCADHQVGLMNDFHLPSPAELFLASLYAPQLFQKSGWYWSSTQLSRGTAFAQDFEYGLSDWSYKDSEFRVRAFRWIPLSP